MSIVATLSNLFPFNLFIEVNDSLMGYLVFIQINFVKALI